jgi:hypothetical protein
LPLLRGKHGADLDLAVLLDAVPRTVPEHACKASISAIIISVYRGIVTVTVRPRYRPGCFYVQPAACRWWCVGLVIAARFIVRENAPSWRVVWRNAPPLNVTKPADVGDLLMQPGHADIGLDAKT